MKGKSEKERAAFGRRLKAWRLQKYWTRLSLVKAMEEAGYPIGSEATISNWERGFRYPNATMRAALKSLGFHEERR